LLSLYNDFAIRNSVGWALQPTYSVREDEKTPIANAVGDWWNILNTPGYLYVVVNLQPPKIWRFLLPKRRFKHDKTLNIIEPARFIGLCSGLNTKNGARS